MFIRSQTTETLVSGSTVGMFNKLKYLITTLAIVLQ